MRNGPNTLTILDLLLQFKVRVWRKKKDSEAHINLLQLIVKFVLFRYFIDLPNFN